MKLGSSIQLKAAFLTIVFLLNTIVGFACALGTDMVFNRDHHPEPKTALAIEHMHDDDNHHEHEQAAGNHHSSEDQEDKDNCCKDEVAKLAKADKLSQRSFDYSLLSLPFFVLPLKVYHISPLSTFAVNTPNAYFVRRCRSPIPDIRLAIQSFQI